MELESHFITNPAIFENSWDCINFLEGYLASLSGRRGTKKRAIEEQLVGTTEYIRMTDGDASRESRKKNWNTCQPAGQWLGMPSHYRVSTQFTARYRRRFSAYVVAFRLCTCYSRFYSESKDNTKYWKSFECAVIRRKCFGYTVVRMFYN